MEHTRHYPANWWWADAISWSRLALMAVFLPVLWQGLAMNDPALRTWSAVILFFLFVTDWLDGYIARRFKITSNFGAMLDTSVDKIVVITPMVLLGTANHIASSLAMGWVLFALTTQREVVMFFGRPFVERQWGIQLHVQPVGKFKMALQCAAIVAAFWPATSGQLSQGLFWGATACALGSEYDYYYTLRQKLAERRREQEYAVAAA